MAELEVLFLGTDSVTPAADDDTASLVLDRRVLVDCGWAAALRLQRHGLTPLDLDYLLLTHGHHDHYLGLPAILFYRWQRGREAVRPLALLGPREDLARVVQLALDLLQGERFGHLPRLELRPLDPGDRFAGDGFTVTTARTIHPVPGLCYRFEHAASGVSVGLTGDTAYHPPLAEHLRGVDLLVHEASHGAKAMRDEPNTYGHSGAPDAALIAQAAGARRLALVHGPRSLRAEAVAAARAIFPESWWPEPGERLALSR